METQQSYLLVNERRNDVTSRWVQQRHGTTTMTHVRNLYLPNRVPKHDKLGFTKRKQPESIRLALEVCFRFFFFFSVFLSFSHQTGARHAYYIHVGTSNLLNSHLI